MNPLVRAIGKVLRLVGISSPEDALPKVKSASDPPSWRERAQGEAAQGEAAQGEAAHGGTAPGKPDEPAS
jgi:hypothetical protein